MKATERARPSIYSEARRQCAGRDSRSQGINETRQKAADFLDSILNPKPKKNIISLTVPGSKGYIPQVGGNDLVRDGGKVDDSADVTNWLLTRLGQIHDQATDLINQHLATLSL